MTTERRPVSADELTVGMNLIWLYIPRQGWSPTIPVNAKVIKINPKTVQIEVQQKVRGEWETVKRNVKLESLRHRLDEVQ